MFLSFILFPRLPIHRRGMPALFPSLWPHQPPLHITPHHSRPTNPSLFPVHLGSKDYLIPAQPQIIEEKGSNVKIKSFLLAVIHYTISVEIAWEQNGDLIHLNMFDYHHMGLLHAFILEPYFLEFITSHIDILNFITRYSFSIDSKSKGGFGVRVYPPPPFSQ